MSEFIVKTVKDWKHYEAELPAIGKVVEVLCTMTTRASLVGIDPVPQWAQEEGAEMQTEVKLWRELDVVEQVPRMESGDPA